MTVPKPWEMKKLEEPEPYKAIRKSSFMAYKKCPKKFWFMYNDDKNYWNYNEKNNNNPAAAKGDIFHSECDGFFETIDYEIAYELDQPTLIKYFRDKFSYSETYKTEKTDMDNWFDWFAKIEATRLNFFKTSYTKSEYLAYYKPKACELKVTMPDEINRTGHIDRIDYLPAENAYMIVEYKTGKNYTHTKPWSLTGLRAETAFYAIICNEAELLDKPVTHWCLYNPTLQEFYIEKFPAVTLRAVNNTYKGMVQKIKEVGDFPRKISPLCLWCDYRRECFHGKKGEPKEYIIPRGDKLNVS